jgi:23S rRNA (cytosine1962-C5)-methyltransferase
MVYVAKREFNPHLIVKEDKAKAIRNRHHWIFSGAVAKIPNFADGDILEVYTEKGDRLGSGYFNKKAKIIGRMIAFDDRPPLEVVHQSLDAAIDQRLAWFAHEKTNAYRLVNAEGDCLPGLIVDRYADLLVIQITTLGMEKLRSWLIDYLVEKMRPKAIYEKSLISIRKEEGLEEVQRLLYGNLEDPVVIHEKGLQFLVEIVEGQKTGFFLDHREMRQFIRGIAAGKRVLNAFSYTGGFSIYAAAGGAVQVDSIDTSESALELAKKNFALNGLSLAHAGFYPSDVFKFLRESDLNYNLIILDPPAFAKKKQDIVPACRGYKDINRLALKKMPPKSFLLTSSCSYYVDESLFQKVVFQAAVEAGRTVKIIGRHLLAPDHPINICHPESDYLKSLFLYVE